MEIMYWKFPHLHGVWSVLAGNTYMMESTQPSIPSIPVSWVGGVPHHLGRSAVVARHMEPPTTGSADQLHLTPEQEALVTTFSAVPGAKKYDGDKPMMDLLIDGCPGALMSVGEVLTYGYKKYGGKHGWKALPDARKRYEAAMLRHQLLLASGEVVDQESRLPHAAHIACNALFLLQFHMEGK